MPVYGAFEAKNKLSELLDRAERGEEVVISKRGKAVAQLVPCNRKPVNAAELLQRIENTRKRLADMRKAQVQPQVTVEEILDLRDAGRK